MASENETVLASTSMCNEELPVEVSDTFMYESENTTGEAHEEKSTHEVTGVVNKYCQTTLTTRVRSTQTTHTDCSKCEAKKRKILNLQKQNSRYKANLRQLLKEKALQVRFSFFHSFCRNKY